MLLGLGIDISLAMNQPQQASEYLDTLPTALHKLTQWSDRVQIRDCFKQTGSEHSPSCLSMAKKALNLQIERFMAET
jgi:hypothetical protein